MDPYLGAIIIGAEVTRLSANIDGVEVSLRCADLARTWQGVGTVIIGTDPPPPFIRCRPLGLACTNYALSLSSVCPRGDKDQFLRAEKIRT